MSEEPKCCGNANAGCNDDECQCSCKLCERARRWRGPEHLLSPEWGYVVRVGRDYFLNCGKRFHDSNGPLRAMPAEPWPDEDGETPDQWSQAKRKRVLKKYEARWAEDEKKRKAYYEAQAKLIESAKAKITEDEYWAIYNEGYGDGRG